jgi:BirA family biotin operon repressor/biotin-[acetyl-CoA-carboxylase] ligase
MLTQHTVEDAAAAAGFSGWVRFAPNTGSTNADLLGMAAAGAPAWSLVVVAHQREGRGRLGRAWVDAPGSSLLMSFLLRPAIPPAEAPLVTLAAGLAMVHSARDVTAIDVRCKWPNDLLASGRKLGGILVEMEALADRIRHVVVGIGVNVSQSAGDLSPELPDVATSVAIEGGGGDLAGLLRASLRRFRELADPDLPGFRQRVLDGYREVCETIGRRVAATTVAGERIEGVASGVGGMGELLVSLADGRTVEVGFGEVVHLR